jgi:hypothetical protein
MGSTAYTNLLRSIQSHIGTLNSTASVLEKRVTSYKMRLEKDPNAEQVTRDLVVTERQLNHMLNTIETLKKFFVKMKKEWEKSKDRVIGHVVWAPPISVNNEPYGYTKDVCVIKLNEKKFLRNFKKNVLDLGMRSADPSDQIHSIIYSECLYSRHRDRVWQVHQPDVSP